MSYHGAGTTLTWDEVVLAEITSVNGVELTVSSVNTTHLASSDYYTTSTPGWITAGPVMIGGNFDYTDTTGQHAMITDLNARSTKEAIITFPTGTGATWTFNAWISALRIGDVPIDGLIPFTATLNVTGKPTFAVATVTGMSAIGFDNDVLMMPTFAIGTFDYMVTITNGQTETVVTPVDATSGEVITITDSNGGSQIVATTVDASAIAVASDEVTTITVTISKTAYAPKVYVFRCAVLAA